MKRRQFITLLGGVAAAWPLAARAQQPAMPVVGWLHAGSPEAFAGRTAAFRQGLGQAGFVEGANVTIEYRWANNDNRRLPEMAADLVNRRVTVIATPGAGSGSINSLLSAKAATTTIPIVFSVGSDPVQLGYVASLNRPGGNITGVNDMNSLLTTKRLDILFDLLPRATRFALLINPSTRDFESVIAEVKAAATAGRREIDIVQAATRAVSV